MSAQKMIDEAVAKMLGGDEFKEFSQEEKEKMLLVMLEKQETQETRTEFEAEEQHLIDFLNRKDPYDKDRSVLECILVLRIRTVPEMVELFYTKYSDTYDLPEWFSFGHKTKQFLSTVFASWWAKVCNDLD